MRHPSYGVRRGVSQARNRVLLWLFVLNSPPRNLPIALFYAPFLNLVGRRPQSSVPALAAACFRAVPAVPRSCGPCQLNSYVLVQSLNINSARERERALVTLVFQPLRLFVTCFWPFASPCRESTMFNGDKSPSMSRALNRTVLSGEKMCVVGSFFRRGTCERLRCCFPPEIADLLRM